MDVFDIIGPVMIGPSSSHTAGAARIGRIARALLGEKPVRHLFPHSFGRCSSEYGSHNIDGRKWAANPASRSICWGRQHPRHPSQWDGC